MGRPLIYQTDAEFAIIPRMRPGGCYFLSIVEALTGQYHIPFTHKSVIHFFDFSIADTTVDVDNEMFVGDPQNLIDDLVGPNRVKFLGKMDPIYSCSADEVEWGCWHLTGNNYNHFTHNNGKGIVLYDPWSPLGSSSVRDGKLIGKRVARLL